MSATGSERRVTGGMVSSDDHLATAAGVRMLLDGGSAADAAVAASAVLAVTFPHACGLGGDVWAVVHEPGADPTCLDASGRAGSGADPGAMRSEGLAAMPLFGDVRTTTVPGCVDGWLALHDRYGRLPRARVLEPAVHYAEHGFAASAELATAVTSLAETPLPGELFEPATVTAGELVRRPATARVLAAIADGGRRAFYEGTFGEALVRAGAGLYSMDDLRRQAADWVTPLAADVWDHRVWAPPPGSQAYTALSALWLAERLPLAGDAGDPVTVHLLVEAMRQAAHDRRAALHAGADGDALIAESRLRPRLEAISVDRAAALPHATMRGSTSYLCAVDGSRLAVSLIQSNASRFGSRVTVPGTGVVLQNRGLGFSLEPGHPAEYGPGRRPPHTLSPFLVTDAEGTFTATVGLRGADAQPQVVLQLLTRLLAYRQAPGTAVAAPRWTVASRADAHFDTWDDPATTVVKVEAGAPAAWRDGLASRGHTVVESEPGDRRFGSAHLIAADGDLLVGVADPRAPGGAASGF